MSRGWRAERRPLMAAARALFDERGPNVALDEVARRVCGGNATLYRHYPPRGDLLTAVYADEIAALSLRPGAALLRESAPGEAFFIWRASARSRTASAGFRRLEGTCSGS